MKDQELSQQLGAETDGLRQQQRIDYRSKREGILLVSILATIGATLGGLVTSGWSTISNVGWAEITTFVILFALVCLLHFCWHKLEGIFPHLLEAETTRRKVRSALLGFLALLLVFLCEEVFRSNMPNGELYADLLIYSILCGGMTYSWLYSTRGNVTGAAYTGAVYGGFGTTLLALIMMAGSGGEALPLAGFSAAQLEQFGRAAYAILSLNIIIHAIGWALIGQIGGILIDIRPRRWPFFIIFVMPCVYGGVRLLKVAAISNATCRIGELGEEFVISVGWILFLALGLGREGLPGKPVTVYKRYAAQGVCSFLALVLVMTIAAWKLETIMATHKAGDQKHQAEPREPSTATNPPAGSRLR